MDTDKPRQNNVQYLYTRHNRIHHPTRTTNRQHHTPLEHQPKHTRTDCRPQTHIQQTHRKHNNKSTQDNTDTQSTHINTMGEQNETILATYKAITRPILEYVSTIWSPLATDTNINKLDNTKHRTQNSN